MSAMDLDMSLDDLAKRNNTKTRGGKSDRGGRGRGARPARPEGPGRVASTLKQTKDKPSPYSRPTQTEIPDGKWGHSGYNEQNNVKGGSLAARMEAKRPPGGIEDPYTNETQRPKRRHAPGIAESNLVGKAMAALGGSSTKGKGPISAGAGLSVKGASGTLVEVRNLAKGTSADDVQAIFSDCGPIVSSAEVPSRIKGAVTVRVKFVNLADAEKARQTFDGQVADGRPLEVAIVNPASPSSDKAPGALLSSALASGITISKNEDLLPDTPSVGGGMRSDALLSNSRAQVITRPTVVGQGRRGRGRGH